MAIVEGKPAPDFTLTNTAGERVGLRDLAGRHVVLYFYPKDDTPGCIKEACGFRDAWAEFEALDVSVYGVSPDDATSHQAFTRKHTLPFPLLSDPDLAMMQSYDAHGEKNMYGRRALGVIRSTVWIDPQGRVRKHWARVPKAEAHPQKVLEALRAALATGQ